MVVKGSIVKSASIVIASLVLVQPLVGAGSPTAAGPEPAGSGGVYSSCYDDPENSPTAYFVIAQCRMDPSLHCPADYSELCEWEVYVEAWGLPRVSGKVDHHEACADLQYCEDSVTLLMNPGTIRTPICTATGYTESQVPSILDPLDYVGYNFGIGCEGYFVNCPICVDGRENVA